MAMFVDGGVNGRKRLADAQGCTETHRVAQNRTKLHEVSQTRTRLHKFDQTRTTLLKKLRKGYFCPKNGVIQYSRTERPFVIAFINGDALDRRACNMGYGIEPDVGVEERSCNSTRIATSSDSLVSGRLFKRVFIVLWMLYTLIAIARRHACA